MRALVDVHKDSQRRYNEAIRNAKLQRLQENVFRSAVITQRKIMQSKSAMSVGRKARKRYFIGASAYLTQDMKA